MLSEEESEAVKDLLHDEEANGAKQRRRTFADLFTAGLIP